MVVHIGVKFLSVRHVTYYDSTYKFSKMNIAESGINLSFLREALLPQLREHA